MEFNRFIQLQEKIKNLPLPGVDAQLKMAPIKRLLELKQQAITQQSYKVAGVMALFYPNQNNETSMALILRKPSKDVHSGQVSFPGGKTETQDKTYLDTALRETEEEIGISMDKIEIIRSLTEIYIPPSNFLVYPYMGFLTESPTFVVQPTEVAKIIEVPVSHFLDDKVVTVQQVAASYGTYIETPAFYINNHVIWGATAMMLNEIRVLIQQSL